LPEDQVRKALKSVIKYNFRKEFKGFKQQPRIFASEHDSGLLTCTWPKGGRPKEPMYYCDEVWTGIEYQVAAHMIFEGMTGDGLKLVEAARARYDGRYRNPWNEVECGDHYVRPMSSWSLLEAISGFRWDAHRKCLHFGPKATPKEFRCFFITDTAWGSASQEIKGTKQAVRFDVKYGKLKVRHLEVESALRAPKGSAQAKAAGKKLACKTKLSDGLLLIDLGQVHTIREGGVVDIELR
jgi:non-lysosomal glucosylceramidase